MEKFNLEYVDIKTKLVQARKDRDLREQYKQENRMEEFMLVVNANRLSLRELNKAYNDSRTW